MKTRMKKDLLQGLIAYPAPVFGGRRIKGNLKRNSKFYQTLSQGKQADRLSRRLAANLEPPKVTAGKRQAVWWDLRRNKNI
jgi:hypothetical protein